MRNHYYSGNRFLMITQNVAKNQNYGNKLKLKTLSYFCDDTQNLAKNKHFEDRF